MLGKTSHLEILKYLQQLRFRDQKQNHNFRMSAKKGYEHYTATVEIVKALSTFYSNQEIIRLHNL